jgi:gentisate 1,2-dioxygenase
LRTGPLANYHQKWLLATIANKMTLNKTEPPRTNGHTNGHHKDTDSAEKLISELPSTHTLPLWAQMAKLNPPEPNPTCIPHIWRYEQLRPYLLRAGELISEKQAERRVLMLINPAREAPYTTDTLYAGLQLVMPNETAPAHRHVAFAMRFVIEGSGGFTAVHGQRIGMRRGDVILTPTWNWHDHGKDGEGPMIWLDALDLPMYRHFPVHFVEHFKVSGIDDAWMGDRTDEFVGEQVSGRGC